jgi:hypothetical protein
VAQVLVESAVVRVGITPWAWLEAQNHVAAGPIVLVAHNSTCRYDPADLNVHERYQAGAEAIVLKEGIDPLPMLRQPRCALQTDLVAHSTGPEAQKGVSAILIPVRN